MTSNLNIRSNVYPMPADFRDIEFFPAKITEEHIAFVRQIRDSRTIKKVSKYVKKHINDFQKNDFGTCSSHSERKVVFGPIKKDKEIIYVCRCDRKGQCSNQKKSNQTCKTCSYSEDR